MVLKGQWAQKSVLEFKFLHVRFATVPTWSKQVMETFDSVLIKELQHISTLPIIERHCQVLMSLEFLAQRRFLKIKGFKLLEKTKYVPNREEATKDLALVNKRNKGVKVGIYKYIYLFCDVIPRNAMVGTMLDLDDLGSSTFLKRNLEPKVVFITFTSSECD